MLLYENPKLGVWLAANHPEAKSFHRGLRETLTGHEQKIIGYERIVTGYEQINIGTEEEPILVEGPPIYGPGDPILEDDLDKPIYEYGPDQYELIGWQEAWGKPPTEEDLEAFQPPPPEENPVTDVEILYKTISERLNGDEAKRTGRPVNPDGAVPVARAIAAVTMLYQGWHYPSEADLATGANPAILAAIYADPTTNTTTESSVEQKRRVLHFTLVMLEGQAFGLEYQAELGAYERTASGQFRAKMDIDTRDWFDLACPKMHKDWPAFDSVRAMFQAVMA